MKTLIVLFFIVSFSVVPVSQEDLPGKVETGKKELKISRTDNNSWTLEQINPFTGMSLKIEINLDISSLLGLR